MDRFLEKKLNMRMMDRVNNPKSQGEDFLLPLELTLRRQTRLFEYTMDFYRKCTLFGVRNTYKL